LDCFNNVRRLTESEGGDIQFGWAIWEWPGVFLEAEHHAVYVPPDGGPWVDITPPQAPVPSIASRLFLPDSTASYDFANEGVRRHNHQKALRKDPLIQEFFQACRHHSDLMNSIPGVGEVKVDARTSRMIERVLEIQGFLFLQMGMKYTPRNSPCFCGSGRKFKHCYGGHQ
jgi:hypothetical protein